MLPQEIIRKKRNGEILTSAEIQEFIGGITTHKVADEQVAAMTMAVFLNGLNKRETTDLTLAMRDSGDVLNWAGFDKPIVDKHSSGGVGDKVSLMLAPLLAACDVYVPMIAGRGLGHTGGTIDKLEAISGYNTQADSDLFRATVKKVGCAIIGQTGNLAPADKKIYAIRDVCATVESIPLITASILSKKLAAGLQYLVMDLKCGNGAFMNNLADAETLARSIVEVANAAGTKTTAVLTDMNQVLGTTVGNALEVREAMEYLQNKNVNKRLDRVTGELAVQLLVQCGRCATPEEAHKKVDTALTSGRAMEKFAEMVASLGGAADFTEKYETYLPHAQYSKPILAPLSGYVTTVDTRAVGLSVIKLGGGRTVPGQKLDLATGFTDFVQVGDFVAEGEPLAVVHYQTEEQYFSAQDDILQAVTICQEQPSQTDAILLNV
jgi:thymidine phosphorylase